MINFLNKFKIPTLLGLAIILIGTASGVGLVVMGNQSLTTKASHDQNPQGITFSNATSSSVTISWQTTAAVPSFVRFGQSAPDEQATLDDRDTQKPNPRNIHYITLKNLTAQTSYQIQIFTGKLIYPEILKFTTPETTNNQNGYKPVIGSVLQNNQPVQEGVVYLAMSGAYTQSALIKNLGSFIIPINNLQTEKLTGTYTPPENSNVKLTAIAPSGKGSIVFKLQNTNTSAGTIKIGQDLDLNTLPTVTSPPLINLENTLDINGDGNINSSDYSTVLKNFGKNPQNKQADINKDGIVDKKDLDLISQKLFPTSSPPPTR